MCDILYHCKCNNYFLLSRLNPIRDWRENLEVVTLVGRSGCYIVDVGLRATWSDNILLAVALNRQKRVKMVKSLLLTPHTDNELFPQFAYKVHVYLILPVLHCECIVLHSL